MQSVFINKGIGYDLEVIVELPKEERSATYDQPAEYSEGYIECAEYKGIDVTKWVQYLGLEEQIIEQLS